MNTDSRQKIMIRFPNWLGDCIMALPVLSVLARQYPDTPMAVMIRGDLAQLISHDPRIDQLIKFDDKAPGSRLGNYLQISDRLRPYKFDLCLILPDSFSAALLAFMAGIPQRIGYRHELRDFLLTRRIAQPSQITHRSRKYLNLLGEIGIDTGEMPFPEIFPDQEAVKRADELVKTLLPYIVIAPLTRAPSRRWGEEKYAALITRIIRELKVNVVLAGAADEYEGAEKAGVRSGVKYCNLAGKTSLLTSYAIMKRATAYVGNDSGGAHLAAASGTYTVSISGADNPAETRPLIKRGKVIRTALSCSPCIKNICPRTDLPMECMRLISVDEVFEALREGLSG